LVSGGGIVEARIDRPFIYYLINLTTKYFFVIRKRQNIVFQSYKDSRKNMYYSLTIQVDVPTDGCDAL